MKPNKLAKAMEFELKYSLSLRIAATLWKHGINEEKFHQMQPDLSSLGVSNCLLMNVYNSIRDMERGQLERGIKIENIPISKRVEAALIKMLE